MDKTNIHLNARTLNDEESTAIISETENFFSYTVSLNDNPEAQPTELDENITADKANELIENTFNYYFARPNNDYIQYQEDTISKELTITEGLVSTRNVGLAFNELRASLKTFFEDEIGSDSSQFTLADAEVQIVSGKAVITLVGSFGVAKIPYVLRNRDFGTSDKWSIHEKGGRYDGAYLGVLGSPEVLSNAINYDLGVLVSGFYTNITTYSSAIVPTASSTNTDAIPTTYSAPDNPMYVYNSTYWLNRIIHYVKVGTGNSDPDAFWITPSTMTYYRYWLKIAANAYVNQYNKNVMKVKIIETIIPSGGSLYPDIHIMHITGAHIVIGYPTQTYSL